MKRGKIGKKRRERKSKVKLSWKGRNKCTRDKKVEWGVNIGVFQKGGYHFFCREERGIHVNKTLLVSFSDTETDIWLASLIKMWISWWFQYNLLNSIANPCAVPISQQFHSPVILCTGPGRQQDAAGLPFRYRRLSGHRHHAAQQQDGQNGVWPEKFRWRRRQVSLFNWPDMIDRSIFQSFQIIL